MAATFEDHLETDPKLIKDAEHLPLLQDFMKHNHVCITHDHLNNTFYLVVRISEYVWNPVHNELYKQAMSLLPDVFNKYSHSKTCHRELKIRFDTHSGRSLAWQDKALKNGQLDHIPHLGLNKKDNTNNV